MTDDTEIDSLDNAPPLGLWRGKEKSLGEALQDVRVERKLFVNQVAHVLRVDVETFRTWLADLQMPSLDDIGPLCDLLELNPSRVSRLISETARRCLHRLVEDSVGTPRLAARRESGILNERSDDALYASIPKSMRRRIAEMAKASETDVSGVVEYVRSLALLDKQARDRWIQVIVAGCTLDEGQD